MNKKCLNIVKIVFFAGIVVLTGVLLNLVKSFLPFDKNINNVFLNGSAGVVIALFYFLLMSKWDKVPLPELSVYPNRKRFKLLCYGTFVGALMLLIVFLLNYFTGSIVVNDVQGALSKYSSISLIFTAMFFAAVWEEIAFRGVLLQKLSEVIGIHTSCVAIALFFGVLHVLSPLSSFQIVVSTVLSGLLLNYAYFYSGNLYLPIGIHFGWNFLNNILFSGVICKVGYLNEFLAGIKNPEQGLIAILITGLAATCFIAMFVRKQNPTHTKICPHNKSLGRSFSA